MNVLLYIYFCQIFLSQLNIWLPMYKKIRALLYNGKTADHFEVRRISLDNWPKRSENKNFLGIYLEYVTQ